MKSKILLVDDNEDLLQIAGLILKSQGYEIFSAGTVSSAQRLIQLQQPQVMLLDVCICEEDGLALCNQLKQNAATKGIRIILMSGNEYNESEWSGADDFLQKPFDFTTLIQKVEKQVQLVPKQLTVDYS